LTQHDKISLGQALNIIIICGCVKVLQLIWPNLSKSFLTRLLVMMAPLASGKTWYGVRNKINILFLFLRDNILFLFDPNIVTSD